METSTLVSLFLVIVLTILNLQPKIMISVAAQSGDSDYLKFVYNATDLPTEAEYDYIVVGGGTAGCPLAATLSTNYSVLVLERGGIPQETPDVFTIEKFSNLFMNSRSPSPAADEFTTEDGVPNIRGRVLGGTSMINAGLYSHGDEDFYVKSGIEWDMGVVKEAYKWVEETVVFRSELDSFQFALGSALLESGVSPDNGFTLDHIYGTKITGSTFNASGTKHGSVEHLNKAVPNNLQVAVHALVEKIIFSGSNSSGLTAVGVIYKDSNGKSHQAMVRDKGEVILSAGTIGTPQLLLLSGVGPQPYLSSLQIPSVHHQPHVGQFVFDTPRISIEIVSPFPLERCITKVVGITRYAYFFPLCYGVPFFSEGMFPSSTLPRDLQVVVIAGKISRPHSVGSLKLASSTDVSITPIVAFNYFKDPMDVASCVIATRKIGQMLTTSSLGRFKFNDSNGEKSFKFMGLPLPANQSDDAAMGTYCRNAVAASWHFYGGCLVGKVVDGGFRVMGIDSLRIVDSSIFTVSPGTNPQATLMMLGRYSGLKIMRERSARN